MKLKNILIAVSDVEKAKKFYKDLFGLDVIQDDEGTVILTEGLVLQDKRVWEECLTKKVVSENHATELYFEEQDIESFVEKLDGYEMSISYVTRLMEYPWGQKVVRIYDLDGNLIEVRTPIRDL